MPENDSPAQPQRDILHPGMIERVKTVIKQMIITSNIIGTTKCPDPIAGLIQVAQGGQIIVYNAEASQQDIFSKWSPP